MHFQDPHPVKCEKCAAESKIPVATLLRLEAVCPNCHAEMRGIGLRMRELCDDWGGFVRINELSLKMEKLDKELSPLSFTDEEFNSIRTLRDLASAVQRRLPPGPGAEARSLQLIRHALQALWLPVVGSESLDVPLLDAIHPCRFGESARLEAGAGTQLNSLQRSILDGKTEEARLCATQHPELLQSRTITGWSLLTLARAKGIPATTAALLRAGAVEEHGKSEYKMLLHSCLQQISHEHTAASWIRGFEYEIWHYVETRQQLPEDTDPYRFSTLPTGRLDDLQFLAEQCGGWWTYEGFVSMQTWKHRYDEWVARRC